ncbi:MAG: DUF975 family protein [Saprospiraceae bacterium]|nr:DUF975 family protein [Saprospiraceae bacterium]
MDLTNRSHQNPGISSVTESAWLIFKKDWTSIIPVFLIPLFYQFFSFYFTFNEYFSPRFEELKLNFHFDFLFDLIFGGAMTIGISATSLAIVRGLEYSWRMIFSGFNRFFRSFAAYLVYGIMVLLFLLLLIIPGIVIALSCSMMFFILAEDQNINIFEAMSKSRTIMMGHKWRLFKICIFFMFLTILSLFTLGLGMLIVAPWFYLSLATFYDEIKLPLPDPSDALYVEGK